MSIEEQIDLFYDAEYVIGTHGAGLTNIIFSCQIKVLELFNSEICQTHYYYLAKSLGHTYGYCNCLEQKKAKRSADFRMNISEVIERMLELEKQHQP
jgi:capsular polysaccharide biosynthesis protein